MTKHEQKEKNCLDIYFNEIEHSTGLSREEECKLAERIQLGDNDALNKLVSSNLKYVVSVAQNYTWSGVAIEDLISAGNIGMISAAKKFNPQKFGTKFITYSSYWIRQSIESLIDSYCTKQEVCGYDDYIFNDDTGEYEDINDIYEENINDVQSRGSAVNELLSCLNQRELMVLESYFGLNGKKQKTLVEIGNEIGLTQERVRQIKDMGIERLQFKAMSSSSYAEFKELY